MKRTANPSSRLVSCFPSLQLHSSRVVSGVFVAILMLLAACRPSSQSAVPTFAPPPTAGPAPGTTYTVGVGDIAELVETRGRVMAKQELPLMFPLAGRLKAVHIGPGDQVEEDTLLVELDAPDLERQMLERQYDLTVAELHLAQAELTAHSQAALAEVRLAQAELALAEAQTQDTQVTTITQELALARLQVTEASSELVSAGFRSDSAAASVKVEQSQAAYQNAAERLGMIYDPLQHKTLEGEVLSLQYDLSLAELSRDKLASEAYYQNALATAELALAEAEYAQTVIDARLAEAERAAEVTKAIQTAQTELQMARISSHLLTATHQLQVDLARAEVEQAQMLYKLASDQISNTLLLAPFSGIIISVEKRPGDQVEAYESIGVIADPFELWLVATVLAEDIDRVTVGHPVAVRLDAYPDQTYTGSVLQVASQSSLWQGRNAYEVTIAFDEGQEVPAIMRMGADVVIAGASHEDVLLVPARAVITIGGQTYVEVVQEDGQIARVEVQTGISDGIQTEIVAGLQAGQVIRIP